MNCKTIQKIIIQDNHKDKSPENKEKIFAHIESCKSCKNLYDNISEDERLFQIIRGSKPKPGNPELLTENIISEIRKIDLKSENTVSLID